MAVPCTGDVQAFALIDFHFTVFTGVANVTNAGVGVYTINTLSSSTAVDVHHSTLIINVHITDPSLYYRYLEALSNI